MFLRKVLHIILFLSCSQLFSQSAPQAIANGQDINVLYRHEKTWKIFAHSRGFGVGYRRGKHLSAKTKSLFEMEGLNLKHPKEIKVKGNDDNSKRFIYGKLNAVGMFRIGTGLQNVIYKRADRKSLEIRCSYIVGATLAIAKPYYVLVYRGNTQPKQTASVPYNSDKLTQDSIVGHGPWIDGINEIKFYPGLHAKFNISFEYAAYSNWVRAIETGVSLDYFPKALPIMARNPAENAVVTLYIGFVFGKKSF